MSIAENLRARAADRDECYRISDEEMCRQAADSIESLTAENERLREAAQIGLSWMGDLEHMGSIVDQERLSSDLAKVTKAIGWVRVDQQSESKDV